MTKKQKLLNKILEVLYKHDIFDVKIEEGTKEEYSLEAKDIVDSIRPKDTLEEMKQKIKKIISDTYFELLDFELIEFELMDNLEEDYQEVFFEEDESDEDIEFECVDESFMDMLSQDIYSIYNGKEVNLNDYEIFELKCSFMRDFIKEMFDEMNSKEIIPVDLDSFIKQTLNFEDHVDLEWLSLKELQDVAEDIFEKCSTAEEDEDRF